MAMLAWPSLTERGQEAKSQYTLQIFGNRRRQFVCPHNYSTLGNEGFQVPLLELGSEAPEYPRPPY